MRKCYEGCDYCCEVCKCGVFDGTTRLREEMSDRCDRALENLVESARIEYRDAWWSYVSEFADY